MPGPAPRRGRGTTAHRGQGDNLNLNTAFLTRNAAVFTDRQTNRECFGCTPEQLAESRRKGTYHRHIGTRSALASTGTVPGTTAGP